MSMSDGLRTTTTVVVRAECAVEVGSYGPEWTISQMVAHAESQAAERLRLAASHVQGVKFGEVQARQITTVAVP